jgi:hypothetical protein
MRRVENARMARYCYNDFFSGTELEEESRKISIMVSTSSVNDEESSPTFQRNSAAMEEPLWRKKENVTSAKKKLNGNLLAGKSPDEEKLLTNGNYMTGNVDDETRKVSSEAKNPEFEMEKIKEEENDSNTESEAELSKQTLV